MKAMMKAFALLLLVLIAIPAGAQSLTGSVGGEVKDEQGGALPGATVSLIGKTGTRTATTGTDGTYRFQAVEVGTYVLEAAMPNFRTSRIDTVVVNAGKQLTTDFAMKVGGVSETLEVVGEAPVVDVQSSQTQNQLSQDLLFNMPIRQGNTAVNILNFVPGINNGAAYGGDSDSANGLLIDGVDTRDPSGGTAWTFYNYNIVEEVQVQGIGAPAEYGAFSGAIVNTITKSGGNRFQGLFDGIYTNKSLGGDNVSAETLAKNPALGDPAKTKNLTDVTAQLSGPIVQDKLFFFASAQRYHLKADPSGPITFRDEVSPRMNFKLNYQPGPNDSLMGSVQYDSYSIQGRCGVSALVCTDYLTNKEDAPEWVWSTNYKHLFGSKTFLELRYTGWWGFYDLNPTVESPLRIDENGAYSANSGQGWFYYADRSRHEGHLSLSHYAEGWGKHSLKFGVEMERSKTRDRYHFVGLYYYDYGGAPYYGYDYGYDIQGRNQRESVFLQDSWQIGDRLTINPGVRVDFLGGKNPDQAKNVYSTTNVAPRFGFAYDLTGDHKTVLKGSYSQYYENIFNDIYKAATPGIEDYITYDVTGCPQSSLDNNTPCSSTLWSEAGRSITPIATIDPDIKHPRVDEISAGFERALTNDVRFSVTGIWRENKNLIGTVLPDARWELRNLTSTAADGLPSQTVPVYRWMNQDESQGNVLITNPDGFTYYDVNGNALGTVDANRKYKGLMLVVSKRFTDRWQAQVSYVGSKTTGNRDNSSEGTYLSTSQFYRTPTLALTNTQGELTNSRRNEIKLMVGVQVPKIEVGLNAYFRSLSGRNYTPEQRFSSSSFGGSAFVPFSSWRTPFVAERGSFRLPGENILDLRLEKIFTLGGGHKNRLALYSDITNVFNKEVTTSVIVRTPSLSIAGVDSPVAFGSPAAIISPRQIQLGARWSF